MARRFDNKICWRESGVEQPNYGGELRHCGHFVSSGYLKIVRGIGQGSVTPGAGMVTSSEELRHER